MGKLPMKAYLVASLLIRAAWNGFIQYRGPVSITSFGHTRRCISAASHILYRPAKR